MLHVILETTKNVNLWLNPTGEIEPRYIALKSDYRHHSYKYNFYSKEDIFITCNLVWMLLPFRFLFCDSNRFTSQGNFLKIHVSYRCKGPKSNSLLD